MSPHNHGRGSHEHLGLRATSKRRLTIVIFLVAGDLLLYIIGGFLSGSLALFAEAGHMVTDLAALFLARLAIYFAERPASAERTFGYRRLEILATQINALILWVFAASVVFEAYERFTEPAEIEGGVMLVVGVIGLGINVVCAWLLRGARGHSVNVEAAFWHVSADLAGSIGIVVSGALVWAFGWTFADPILSVFIAVLIFVATWHLIAKVTRVLLEGTPDHIDVYRLCSEMEEVDGVIVLHDIHVWSITPGYDVLTAHVLIDPAYAGDVDALRGRLRKIAADDFGIEHITLQLERSASDCTEHHHVDHLHAHERPSKKAKKA